MKKLIYMISGCLLFTLTACDSMNDMHEKYTENGERTYIGKVDSVRVFSGDKRIMFRCWITDPRAKNLTIYWDQFADSVKVKIPAHNPLDPIDVMVTPIEEGDYTFYFVSRDNKGLKSINYDLIGKVYGNQYVRRLMDRQLLRCEPNLRAGKLTTIWGGSVSSTEMGVEVYYTKKSTGEQTTILFDAMALANPTIIIGIDLTKEVWYSTVYKPDANALDVFRTEKTKIQIQI